MQQKLLNFDLGRRPLRDLVMSTCTHPVPQYGWWSALLVVSKFQVAFEISFQTGAPAHTSRIRINIS